jgi:hypothetical protein
MTDELLAYLLDDLSPDERAAVEDRLCEDPAWRREYQRLRECLATTGDPRECVEEPPCDLLARTCGLVERAGTTPFPAQSSCFAGVTTLSAAVDPAGAASRWSLTDCTVGAGVLGVLAMLMLPALRESRDTARRQVCQARLGTVGTILYEYQENHDKQLPAVNPGEPAGMFAVELVERAGVPRDEMELLVTCPNSEEAMRRFTGEATPHIPTRAELAAAKGSQRVLLVRTMGGSTAYVLGRYDEQHVYHQPRFTGGSDELMCADAPRLSRSGVHSVNHVGGQNVLDQSLRVTFLTDVLWAADKNIFLNFAGRPAAGKDDDDQVLARSDHGPEGPISEGPIVELRAE